MTDAIHTRFHGRELMNRDVAGFALREVVHRNGGRVPKHSHANAHIAFVLDGVFEEVCEGKLLPCQPKSVSFLAPGMVHSDHFMGKTRSLLIELSPERLADLQTVIRLDEPVFVQHGRASWLASNLYRESLRRDASSDLAIEGVALEILDEVARRYERHAGAPGWLRLARELINDRFADKLSHDAIAHEVSVHPVHLATMFRRHFGCTIGEYIRRLRVENACRQLCTSDLTLAEIALNAGFFDQSHFTNVFKRSVGTTPARFRDDLR